MILFENTILKLDYNPASDILEVVYPDLHDYLISEIKNSITILVNTVKNYDVKKLLLDARNTVISVGEAESREIASFLATGLIATRTQKVARIQSGSALAEATSQSTIYHVQQNWSLPYQIQNFTDKAAANSWLVAPHS